jgi:uncharacterized protein
MGTVACRSRRRDATCTPSVLRPASAGRLPFPLRIFGIGATWVGMKTLDTLMAEEGRTTALEFPTAFPIKVMGRRTDDFAQAIVDVVLRHAPDFDPASLEMRASREGNYLSVTATITATSREQLDALYRELTSHPLVLMAL